MERARVVCYGDGTMFKKKGSTRRKTYHRGRWAVDRERFRIEDAVPPGEGSDFVTMGQAMGAVMSRTGLDYQKRAADMLAQWSSIAGDAVGRHTRPVSLKDGVLTVEVDSSVWLNEISRFGKGILLEKVQKVLGVTEVKSLRLQVGGGQRG